jgi:GTP-binding protein HflX
VSATQGTGLKGLRAWLEQTFWGASPSPVTPGLVHQNSADADA